MKIKKLAVAFCLCAGIMGTMFGMSAAAEETAASDKDYSIGGIDWDYSDEYINGIWDEPSDKTSYKVQLYKGTTKVGNTASTSSEHYDFSKLIMSKGSGTYYFTVYPSKGGTSMLVKSDKLAVTSDMVNYLKENHTSSTNTTSSGSTNVVYSEPGTSTTSGSQTPAGTAGWQQDAKGWWFKNANGTWPASTWQSIAGVWYYFGTDGYMLHDTTTPDGYWVNSSGAWIQ